jgi:mRNA-degrading endonuclease toxin of MazEF toxin-antitoxin module
MDKVKKAEVGSLLFMKDELDAEKTRPFICVHVFSNEAGVPYDWLVMPITSNDGVGTENLVEVTHEKLISTSYAKINNMKCISWSDKIELSSKKFKKQHVKDILGKLKKILSVDKDGE